MLDFSEPTTHAFDPIPRPRPSMTGTCASACCVAAYASLAAGVVRSCMLGRAGTAAPGTAEAAATDCGDQSWADRIGACWPYGYGGTAR